MVNISLTFYESEKSAFQSTQSYFSTSNVKEVQFLYILTYNLYFYMYLHIYMSNICVHIYVCLCVHINFSRSWEYVLVSHYNFNLYSPND